MILNSSGKIAAIIRRLSLFRAAVSLLRAFDLDAADYIVRPITWARFLKAVTKAQLLHSATHITVNKRSNILFIKEDSHYVRIAFDEIDYVKAMGDYAVVMNTKKKFIVHQTMKNILKKLPPDKFVRVHHSYIVNISKITVIGEVSVHFDNEKIPISRKYKKDLLSKLQLL